MTTAERIEMLLAQAANPPKSASEVDISNWRTEAGELYLAEFLRRAAGMNWTQWTLYRQGQQYPEIGLALRAKIGPLNNGAPQPSRSDALDSQFASMWAGTSGDLTNRYTGGRG